MTDNSTIECCVPNCYSNSKKDPTKIFIKVPKNGEFEKQWIKAVGKAANYSAIQNNSHLSLCQDHINLPNDLINWTNIQNTVLKINAKNDNLLSNGESSMRSVFSLKIKSPEILNQSIFLQEPPLLEVDNNEEKKSKSFIKRCLVPNCMSNSHDNPEKQLIRIPNELEVRKKLTEIFGNKGKHAVYNERSAIFCCSDHLDFSKDLKRWVTFDSETGLPIRIKKHGLSHIFPTKSDSNILTVELTEDSNPERTEPKLGEPSQSFEFKKINLTREKSEKPQDESQSAKMQEIVQLVERTDFQLLEKIDLTSRENSPIKVNIAPENDQLSNQIQDNLQNMETTPEEKELIILDDDSLSHEKIYSDLLANLDQLKNKKLHNLKYSDQSVQCNIESTNHHYDDCKFIENKYPFKNINLSLCEERSLQFLKTFPPNQDNCNIQKKSKIDALFTAGNNSEFINQLIKSDPLKYVGLPAQVFQDFMKKLEKSTKLSCNKILLVLLKIRENQSFERLADSFGISQEEALNNFVKSVPLIAKYLKENTFWPKMNSDSQIPLFQQFFQNFKIIIDCLEVEVEKPKKPHVAEILKKVGKNCYSVKYLISYTTEGLVNFMSQGYGGSRKDDFLLLNSGFLLRLSFSSADVILTEISFKDTEPLFEEKNCELFQLSKTLDDQKLEDFSNIKKLHDHVRCVKKRLREFRLISTHANLNYDLTSVIDFIVIIACAIVNLQGTVPHEE